MSNIDQLDENQDMIIRITKDYKPPVKLEFNKENVPNVIQDFKTGDTLINNEVIESLMDVSNSYHVLGIFLYLASFPIPMKVYRNQIIDHFNIEPKKLDSIREKLETKKLIKCVKMKDDIEIEVLNIIQQESL